AEQRQALDFIASNLFDASAMKVSPELLRRMGQDTLSTGSDQPVNLPAAVQGVQTSVLAQLYSPKTLTHLTDNQLYTSNPGGSLSASEMMDRVRRSIWSEADPAHAADVDLYRRNLQTQHMAILVKTMQDASVPADARVLARRDVERIARDLKATLDGPGIIDHYVGGQQPVQLDDATRLHYESMLREAAQALTVLP
ncbi:MAG: zinc-dependent metalloprotease, partial [Elusimicrobia bacterium]|nr:zinc-dependent metalloprotease [Elusimicrobiota bacterium]